MRKFIESSRCTHANRVSKEQCPACILGENDDPLGDVFGENGNSIARENEPIHERAARVAFVFLSRTKANHEIATPPKLSEAMATSTFAGLVCSRHPYTKCTARTFP